MGGNASPCRRRACWNSRPAYGDAEGLLRVLERSLQLMIQYRAMLLDELMSWPDYR